MQKHEKTLATQNKGTQLDKPVIGQKTNTESKT